MAFDADVTERLRDVFDAASAADQTQRLYVAMKNDWVHWSYRDMSVAANKEALTAWVDKGPSHGSLYGFAEMYWYQGYGQLISDRDKRAVESAVRHGLRSSVAAVATRDDLSKFLSTVIFVDGGHHLRIRDKMRAWWRALAEETHVDVISSRLRQRLDEFDAAGFSRDVVAAIISGV